MPHADTGNLLFTDLKQIKYTEKIKFAYLEREWLVPAPLFNLEGIEAGRGS